MTPFLPPFWSMTSLGDRPRASLKSGAGWVYVCVNDYAYMHAQYTGKCIPACVHIGYKVYIRSHVHAHAHVCTASWRQERGIS